MRLIQGPLDPESRSIMDDVFAPQLSIAPRTDFNPVRENDDFGCPGGLAKGPAFDKYSST